MREKNYGIEVLRIILTFQVVMGHNGDRCFGFVGSAVPFFMLISFYLTYNIFVNQDMAQIRRRAFRVIEPYVMYGLLSFAVMFSLGVFFDGKIHVSIKDLMWQLLLGTSPVLDPPLWYLFDLIVCSFVMLLICRLGRYKFYLISLVLFGSFVLQYTDVNWSLFNGFRYEVKWPLGRLLEMLPYTCAGGLLAHSKVFEKEHGNTLLIFAIFMLYLILGNYRSMIALKHGFMYQGAPLFLHTILIFAFFHLVLLEKSDVKYIKAIEFLSKYSLGVFLHSLYRNERFQNAEY